MLNEIFWKLLEMSVKGGVVILAVLAVRLLLRRAPRKAVFVLWAAVLLRLLCPLTINSPVGLLSEKEIIPAATVTVTPMPVGASPAPVNMTEYTPRHTESVAPPVGNPASAPVQPLPNTDTPKAERHITWKELLPYLWLSGCILLLGYSIGSGLRLRYRLRESVETEKRVRAADGLESAFVLGLLRPTVYLPSELPEGARPYIIAHERAHIRRLDTLWKRLGWLTLCLHWFNPLVWLAFFLASRDMEMACDEQVLGRNAGDIRADYSELLLRLSTGKHFLAAPLAFGEGDTGSRIKHILKWKKPRTWLVIGAALICIAAVIFCVLERSGKETVWEREVPEFRTTIRVQTVGQKFAVSHTRPKKRAADGTKSDNIHMETIRDGELRLMGNRTYYDAVRNRTTNDSLSLYLLTPENIKELRDADWAQPGLFLEVRVLDGEALAILCVQNRDIRPEETDVMETGLLLASGGKPDAAEQTDETTPPDETAPPENIDLSVPEGYRALTAEEIQTANDHLNIQFSDWAEKRDLTGAVHAFHTCHYDDPTELDLQEFLRYLLYGDETLQAGEDEDEFQLWQARGGRGFAAAESIADMPVPVHRYPKEKVNEVLMEYAGITVDDLILPYWEMSYYLPETDAFYNTTSDFAMGTFRCEAGETDGETVRLYTDASRHSCAVLTLRKSGEKWMIAARQMTDENGNILSAVLAGEWQYRLSAKYMQELFENRETLPLDDLIRFLLKADGAYAEGGAAELYRRFLQSPVELLRYLITLGNVTVPEHPGKTAAQTLGGLLISESIRQGEADSARETLRSLYALYPQSRQTRLLDELLLAADAAGEAAPVPEGYRALTAEELRTANDHLSIPFSDWSRKQDLTGAVQAFFLCYYDDPSELGLREFLRYLLYGGEELQAGEDEEEFQLWQARNGFFAAEESIADMPVPVHRYSAEKVNEVLTEYAGITVDDLILPYWEMSYYLPETDAFYNTTSDFGMGTFRCEAGETDGETVRLYTDASRHSCAVLTLRKSGEKWMIAAQQMTDENGNILSAVLAGEWQYRLSAKYMQELFDNRETLPLDDLIRFLLKADGAYAEGGAAELYRRFLQSPVELMRYLITLGNVTVLERPGKTAAQAVCEMLAAEAAWFGDAEAFDEALSRCMAAFPEGRGKALTEYLWSRYRQMVFSQSNHLRMLAEAGRTDAEDGLALYHDGWEKAVTLQNLGEYPWGYPFTAQDVSYYHSDGFNSYRAVCTDGTVLSGFLWDSAELLDIVSLTDIYTENPTFATPDGIRVGMQRSEIPGAGSGDFYIAAQKDYLQLVIHFDGDTVSALELVQGMDTPMY